MQKEIFVDPRRLYDGHRDRTPAGDITLGSNLMNIGAGRITHIFEHAGHRYAGTSSMSSGKDGTYYVDAYELHHPDHRPTFTTPPETPQEREERMEDQYTDGSPAHAEAEQRRQAGSWYAGLIVKHLGTTYVLGKHSIKFRPGEQTTPDRVGEQLQLF